MSTLWRRYHHVDDPRKLAVWLRTEYKSSIDDKGRRAIDAELFGTRNIGFDLGEMPVGGDATFKGVTLEPDSDGIRAKCRQIVERSFAPLVIDGSFVEAAPHQRVLTAFGSAIRGLGGHQGARMDLHQGIIVHLKVDLAGVDVVFGQLGHRLTDELRAVWSLKIAKFGNFDRCIRITICPGIGGLIRKQYPVGTQRCGGTGRETTRTDDKERIYPDNGKPGAHMLTRFCSWYRAYESVWCALPARSRHHRNTDK